MTNPPSMQQALNDLKWAVSSPSLVHNQDLVDIQGVVAAQEVDLAQINGDQLVDFLAERRGHRVGRYFEALVAFWLEHVLHVEMVGHGVQIKDGKKTIGEIDFLFRDGAGRMNHWEVAVKFFLHFPGNSQVPNSNGSHYPGPNASDSFELKTEKLFQSQLQISKQHFPEVQVRKGLMRGIIFYHQEIEPPSVLPAHLAPDHQQGKWLRESELAVLETFGSPAGFIANKPFWLSAPFGSEMMPMPELLANVAGHFDPASTFADTPLMVCLMNQDGSAELERVFVVPDSWPLRKR